MEVEVEVEVEKEEEEDGENMRGGYKQRSLVRDTCEQVVEKVPLCARSKQRLVP